MAGQQGHIRAMYNLGQMYLNGLGTVRDCPTGVKFLKTVSERGSWAGILGEAHRHFLNGRFEHAVMLCAAAAEMGYDVAQSNSAWLMSQGLGYAEANQHELAIKHFTWASEQGDVDSLRMLGDYWWYGWASPDNKPDYQKAAKYYQSAADGRNAQAMFNLGYMHEQGILSGKPDFHLAKRYYDMALETDPDAVVPVRLALFKLWVTQLLKGEEGVFDMRQWSFWPSSISKAWELLFGSSSSSTAAATPAKAEEKDKENAGKTPAQQQQQQEEEKQQQQPKQQARQRQQQRRQREHESWLGDMHPEDLLLLILLGLLAVVVYLRANPERPQQAPQR